MGSQVSNRYFDFAMPHSNGQLIIAESPAATPRLVCPSTIFAFFPAIDMSANNPATNPAPTAGPFIADTIGFEQFMTL